VWQLSEIGYQNGLSPFIKDLPEHVASRESAGMRRLSFDPQSTEKGSFDTYLDQRKSTGFAQGDRVRHPAFGPGVVSKFVSNDKVEVLFRNAGRKLLHLEYTTLEKI
jgi:DNA helicase-2/ATP-dependent DNA helicase PcrA